MDKTVSRSGTLAFLLVGSMLVAGPASASLINCSDVDGGLENKVNPNQGCQILEPLDGNQNDSPTLINNTAFFGYSDWSFDGKYDDDGDALTPDPGDPATIVSFDGDAESGTWGLVDLDFWASFDNLMMVFKDGGNTNLVAYDITTGALNGDYATPFTSPPFPLPGAGNDRDISHVSIYYRDNGHGEIPAPGSLLLVGLGLVMLGWSLRRRKKPAPGLMA